MSTMEVKVKTALGQRGPTRLLAWLEQQGEEQKIAQQRLHEMQQEFNRAQ
jgi:hypothetical protein